MTLHLSTTPFTAILSFPALIFNQLKPKFEENNDEVDAAAAAARLGSAVEVEDKLAKFCLLFCRLKLLLWLISSNVSCNQSASSGIKNAPR